MYVTIKISPGELVDRITILQVKTMRIKDDRKLRNINTELAMLRAARAGVVPVTQEIVALDEQLFNVNSELWYIEDDLRVCEDRHDFGDTFISLARSVYTLNDKRAALKRAINELLKSSFVEEKYYTPTSC